MAEGSENKVDAGDGENQKANLSNTDTEATSETVANPQEQLEPGEVESTNEPTTKTHPWCKVPCDPNLYPGFDHYFLNMEGTTSSVWEEPSEPYWVWDLAKGAIDASGLHYPSKQQATSAPPTDSGKSKITVEPDPDYQGYNPRIHGKYDPNAPYAQYHKRKREEEEAAANPESAAAKQVYGSVGAFNRFTGAFQGGDKAAANHDGFAKSGRQMNAFFDVDAAANSHDGRSLKAERQQQKYTKKEIKEMNEKRRQKKEKKRMDFLKS